MHLRPQQRIELEESRGRRKDAARGRRLGARGALQWRHKVAESDRELRDPRAMDPTALSYVR